MVVIGLAEHADLGFGDFLRPAASEVVIPGKKKPTIRPAFADNLGVVYVLTLEVFIMHHKHEPRSP